MFPVAGISFISPLMLAGAALVSLPIIAHLLSRRTRRRIVFPTIRLLSESSASTSKMYRLRRWLVLLLRCLAVFLIVLAFARPVWLEHTAAAYDEGAGAGVVILLDISASTSRQDDGVSLINSIGALAERTLSSLESGRDWVGIVYASAQPHAALPELSNNLEIMREELRRLKPTRERANFPEAIALAGKLLQEHRGQHRLVVLSDMQRSNWADVTLKSDVGRALPRGTVLTILPVGGGKTQNISLSNPRALPVQPIINQPVKLVVHAANYSDHEETVRVSATLDGDAIGTETVKIKAWDGTEVEFETLLASPGQHRVVFSIAPDALSVDNFAYLTINAVRRVPVVVVGDDDPNRPGSSTYFLIRALAPRGDMGDDLEVTHLSSADLNYARIADAEAVFVGYISKLSSPALEALYMYINQGGGVCFGCGEGPVVENLLALRNIAKQTDILPWTPQEPRNLARDGQFLRILDGAWQSRLFADFDEHSQLALKEVRFGRVWSTSPLAKGAASLLRYTDHTPALTSQSVGTGKLVLLNFSPSLNCSDIGKHGVYVALMQSLFEYLRPTRRQRRQAIAGEPLTYPVTVSLRRGPVRLVAMGPDQQPYPCEITGDSSRLLVHIRRPKLPGFYTIIQKGLTADTAETVAQIPVNVDPREGDLRRADPEVIREHLAGENLILKIRGQGQTGPILRVRGLSLWPWLLLATMVVIGMELILLCIWKR
ncbi:MAG: BatA and WFA domain-containing protein [Planctomycetia bacterium]|nr:BatA and WFA domain-containing protein [Planctomycetia bacterium]